MFSFNKKRYTMLSTSLLFTLHFCALHTCAVRQKFVPTYKSIYSQYTALFFILHLN